MAVINESTGSLLWRKFRDCLLLVEGGAIVAALPLETNSPLTLTIIKDLSGQVQVTEATARRRLMEAQQESLVQHLYATGIGLRLLQEAHLGLVEGDRLSRTIDELDHALTELSAFHQPGPGRHPSALDPTT